MWRNISGRFCLQKRKIKGSNFVWGWHVFYLICVNISHNFDQTNGSTLPFPSSFSSSFFPTFISFVLITFLPYRLYVFVRLNIFPLFSPSCSFRLFLFSSFLYPPIFLFKCILSIHLFPFLRFFSLFLIYFALLASFHSFLFLSCHFFLFFFQTVCLNPAILQKLISDIWQV